MIDFASRPNYQSSKHPELSDTHSLESECLTVTQVHAKFVDQIISW